MSAVTAEPIHLEPTGRHLRLVPALEVRTEPRPRLHITRRGRLVATMSVMVALAAVAAITLTMVLPASGAREVVVQSGQTLSQIAASELPGVPLDRAIMDLQLANDMSSLHVQSGQTLQLP
ncbi:MAG: LysM peptidoglycan-binding domain-containing protein [Ornithinimicrobium sp.]